MYYQSVTISAGIYLFKVNKENARTMCEICSKVTINYYCSLFNLGQNQVNDNTNYKSPSSQMGQVTSFCCLNC